MYICLCNHHCNQDIEYFLQFDYTNQASIFSSILTQPSFSFLHPQLHECILTQVSRSRSQHSFFQGLNYTLNKQSLSDLKGKETTERLPGNDFLVRKTCKEKGTPLLWTLSCVDVGTRPVAANFCQPEMRPAFGGVSQEEIGPEHECTVPETRLFNYVRWYIFLV